MRSLYTHGQGWLMALLVLGAAIGVVSCASASENYSAVILADNPLGYWRLGGSDASQPAVDASGNGNNGVYEGGVTLGQPGAIVNDPDTAALFDGTTGRVRIPGAPFNLANNFTFEAWVINAGQGTGGPLGRILSNGVPGSRGYGWGVLTDDRVRFTTYGILDYDSDLTCVPPDGTFHYVAVTLNSNNTATFYVDGELTDGIEGPAPARSSELDLLIGDNPAPTLEPWNGTLDEVAIYNTVLTPAQIMAHFQAGISP